MATTTFTADLSKTDMLKTHKISLGDHQIASVCPPPMVKDQPDSTSPHQLFLASIGSCVNLVFEIALTKAHIDVIDLKSQIIGEYDTDESTNQSKFTSVMIDTIVTVPEGTSEKRLQRLFDLAHENCPIGNCLIGSCVKLLTHLEVKYA